MMASKTRLGLKAPPRPMAYAKGKVTLNGAKAVDGMILFARIGDYETEHQPAIRNGGYEFLKLMPIERRHIGEEIRFYLRAIDGSEFEALETDVFEEGSARIGFDLTF